MRKKTFKGTCVTHNRVYPKRKYLSEKEVEYLVNQMKTCENIYPVPKTTEEAIKAFRWWYGAKRNKRGYYISEKAYFYAFTIENIRL